MPTRYIAIGLAFLTGLMSSSALAEGWMVARVTGRAWIVTTGAQPVAATTGMAVNPGATVATTSNGRAMLTNGRDSVVVSPNTVLALPPDAGGRTTVLQQSGQIEVDVQRRSSGRFAVETPFLAAVVKGTRFTVRVSARGADVEVEEGHVEVANLETGQVADVLPGQRAGVDLGRAGGRLGVGGAGALPAVRQGEPRVPILAPSGAAPNPRQDGPAAPQGAANLEPPSQGGQGLFAAFVTPFGTARAERAEAEQRGPSEARLDRGGNGDNPGRGDDEDRAGRNRDEDHRGGCDGDDRPGPGDDPGDQGRGDNYDQPGRGDNGDDARGGDDRPGPGDDPGNQGRGENDDQPGPGDAGDNARGHDDDEDRQGRARDDDDDDRRGRGDGGDDDDDDERRGGDDDDDREGRRDGGDDSDS